MRAFIKDNIVLVAGISLPLVLVIVFVLAGIIPQYTVADPKFDVIFSDRNYNKYQFEVVDQHVHITAMPGGYYGSNNVKPKLYRYNAASKQVQEINYTMPDLPEPTPGVNIYNNPVNTNINIDPTHPPTAQQAEDTSKAVNAMKTAQVQKPVSVPVKELEGVTLNTDSISPDGYELKSHYRTHSGGMFVGGGSYSGYTATLAKGGKRVALPYPKSNSYEEPRLLGWVVQ